MPTALPASFVFARTATLNGEVNPENSATGYRFEYGPCGSAPRCPTSPYPDSAPSHEAEAGSGFGAVAISEQLEELQTGTTYHYRVVAVDATGEATSKKRCSQPRSCRRQACSPARRATSHRPGRR